MDTERESVDRPAATAGAGRGGFGLGLLVGALLGATVALLFAPAPGHDTRRRLRRRLEDVR
ncbi:MAG: YtxH domain-containing protein, partial [Gemmatimonadales bacterium]|nr:YtxH domain-containing protein [Gemmatimonadales bacterium]